MTKHETSTYGMVKLFELEEHFGRTIHVHFSMGKLLCFSWLQYVVGRKEKSELTSKVPSNSKIPTCCNCMEKII